MEGAWPREFVSPWARAGMVAVWLAGAFVMATDPKVRLHPVSANIVCGCFLVLAFGACRSVVILNDDEVILRNWFWTRRVPRDDVVAVGLEGRWYLRGSSMLVVRTGSGKKFRCIALTGSGRATGRQVDELASTVGVPREDRN
jgi:hypothetical protein